MANFAQSNPPLNHSRAEIRHVLQLAVWCCAIIVLQIATGRGSVAKAETAPVPAALISTSFETGLDGWRVESNGDRVSAVLAEGCRSAHCLKVEPMGDDIVRLDRVVESLERGSRYRLRASIKSPAGHRVWMSLRDADWRAASCSPMPLTIYTTSRGRADWQVLEAEVSIPERDPCGSTEGHAWALQIEVESRGGHRDITWIDRVELLRSDSALAPLEHSRPVSCGYHGDRENRDACPSTTRPSEVDPRTEELVTVAKWKLDDPDSRWVREDISGYHGLREARPDTTRPSVTGRIRVSSGQPIAGDRFEIYLEVFPARGFESGCMLASRSAGSNLGGFRLCYSAETKLLGFEMSSGSQLKTFEGKVEGGFREGEWTPIRIRSMDGVLEMFVFHRRVLRREGRRLRLTRSPFDFVIGGSEERSEPAFLGRVRNVTLRGRPALSVSTKAVPLGLEVRGHWPIDEGAGKVVFDTTSRHNGLIELNRSGDRAVWRDRGLWLPGTPDGESIMVPDAGQIYGDDFEIRMEVMFADPRHDSGMLLLNRSGSAVAGGFSIHYWGSYSRLSVELANGEQKKNADFDLPFRLPGDVWIEFVIRLAHGQLTARVANIEIGSHPFPDFRLAESRTAMRIGGYYYGPAKGIRGSFRDVRLSMLEENIDALPTANVKPAKTDCHAIPIRDFMIVANNLDVPNWFGTTCPHHRERPRPVLHYFDVPLDFEIVASGSTRAEFEAVVPSHVKKRGKVEHGGRQYRRYEVELESKRNGATGYGPIYIRSSRSQDERTDSDDLPRFYFVQIDRAGKEEPRSISLVTKQFPELGGLRKLHNGLGWILLEGALTWPDFAVNVKRLGFNSVPAMSTYYGLISKKTRIKYLAAARKQGLSISMQDSPYTRLHLKWDPLWIDAAGYHHRELDPSYRGELYDVEMDRVSTAAEEIMPDIVFFDIESLRTGTYACLTQNSPRCSEYLVSRGATDMRDVTSDVTRMGSELLRDLRNAVSRPLGDSAKPLFGVSSVQPMTIYHSLFDFNELYQREVDFAQPVLYRASRAKIGSRIREIRSQMPRGDIIPWVDPGTVAEYPTEQVYDRVLEILGAGARGISWFSYSQFEGSDFYYMARALQSVIPVEDVIFGSDPMDPIQIREGGVAAHGLVNGGHAVFLISDYGSPTSLDDDGAKPVVLRFPEGIRGPLWDLARGVEIGEVKDDEVRFPWQPAMPEVQSGLYYIGPRKFAPVHNSE